ncbi:DUF1800 domain-containing protein [Mariniluteicoccus flavus]
MARLNQQLVNRRAWERLGFGASPQERGQHTDAIAALLTRPDTDPGAAATPPPEMRPRPKITSKSSVQEMREANEIEEANRQAMTRWWLVRMATAHDQLSERMTWFWHGHFATSVGKVTPNALMLTQNETLRRHALGDFRELARAMVVDPALILWLDGQRNNAKSPNENLARELMELFCLGVGNYTEADVREGARALTGWQVTDGRAVLNPKQQDARPTTIFGHTGTHDARAFVDLCLARPESAAFVVDRVWFRFMGERPAPAATRARLLSAYAGGDIRALMGALARDPAFSDDAYAMVRSPVDWFVGVVRAVGADLRTWEPKALDSVIGLLRRMGQVPFVPPSVGGWPSGQVWLSSSPSLARTQLASQIAASAKLSARRPADGQTVAEAWARAFGVTWTPRTRTALAKVDTNMAHAFVVAACSPEVVISR